MTKPADPIVTPPPHSPASARPGSDTSTVTQRDIQFFGISPAQGQRNLAGEASQPMNERSVKNYKKAVVKSALAEHVEQREAERKKANSFINWLKRVIFGPDAERDMKSFVKKYAPNTKHRKIISEIIAEHIGEFDLRVVAAYAKAVKDADEVNAECRQR
ncbi:MAG: hypothetical protein LBF94_00670 [Puniceicoccales bacterium]|nr:hypothetical protein [Puniceicoccales bacterium]